MERERERKLWRRFPSTPLTPLAPPTVYGAVEEEEEGAGAGAGTFRGNFSIITSRRRTSPNSSSLYVLHVENAHLEYIDCFLITIAETAYQLPIHSLYLSRPHTTRTPQLSSEYGIVQPLN